MLDNHQVEPAILPTVNGVAAYEYQHDAFAIFINELRSLLCNVAVADKACTRRSVSNTQHLDNAATVPATALNIYGSAALLDMQAQISCKDDARSFLKDTREDMVDSSSIKSAKKRCLSLHKLIDFSVVPPPLLIYTLHSSDSVSEQDYVRNLMALPPEEREALMKSEAERLRTYGAGFWPIREVMPPEELAAAGFYYTGVHDRVQCAFCRGVLRNWERGDSAMNEHRVHFSYCRLVMGLDCGNVPIASGRPNGENTSAVPTRGGQANLFALTGRPLNDAPDNTSFANLLGSGHDLLATMGSGEPLPGVSTEEPKHPEHAVEARRLQSFSTWPSWALQSPENLAKAGFYYAGFGDCVKCFYCDGGLRNWEIMDNPWEEHARWFKDCKYLLDVKNKAYVDEIQKKYAVGNEAARLVVHPSVQLVKSLGYSENQVLTALERFFPRHQTGSMPKGAELLDAVLQMEDESSGGPASFIASSFIPALGAATRSLPINEAAAFAVAASRPAATASVPPRSDRQRPEPDGISSGPNAPPVHSSRAPPDLKRMPEPPPSERLLASLHDGELRGEQMEEPRLQNWRQPVDRDEHLPIDWDSVWPETLQQPGDLQRRQRHGELQVEQTLLQNCHQPDDAVERLSLGGDPVCPETLQPA